MITENQFSNACKAITEIHNSDPNQTIVNGVSMSTELLYSNRMEQILHEFLSDADYYLVISAKCQHLERWKIARDLYPMDRRGYHQWRRAVMDFQLKRTTEVLANSGFGNADIAEITGILSKQGNKTYVKAQIIEDVACIVFVIWYLEGFAARHESSKVNDIVAKTTRKMSEKGIQFLQHKSLSGTVQEILAQLKS